MTRVPAPATRRRLALTLVLATALTPITVSATAWAADPTLGAVNVDVPAGPLGAALARLGQQMGVVIVVDPALVRGRETSGISGRLTSAESLERLLTGTGLTAVRDDAAGYRIVRAPVPAAPVQAERLAPRAALPALLTPPDAEMDEIVVVGTLTNVAIGTQEIQRRQSNDLSDLFRQVPSVSVGGGAVGIAQKVYVRGLEDSLLNVTVDGAPQRGTLFHHIGRVSIEPELLRSVEVQAGAGEATSGFGAVGGAIRFRTQDADDLLAPGRRIGAIAKAGWFSNDGHKLSGTVYARLFDGIGFVGSAVKVERQDVRTGGGDRLRGTSADQQLLYAKLGGSLGGHLLSVSYERRDEEASFGQRPNWPVVAGEPLFPAKGKRETVVLNHQSDLGPVNLESTGYWTESGFTQDRYDRWGLYGATIRTQGFDIRARTVLDSHRLTAGAEYRDDRVVGAYLAAPSIWGPWAWSTAVGRFEEKGEVFGLYLQDHWQVTPDLLLSAGVRYDSYDLRQVTYENGTDSDGVSVNAGLTYSLTNSIDVNAGYAQAFRGKEIGDAFTLEKRPGRISLAPDLRPEKVHNVEAGLSYSLDGVRASAVYYNMRIDDVILDQIGRGAFPQDTVYYENVGRFRAQGVELRAGYSIGPFTIDGFFNHYVSKLNGNAIEGYEHIALGNSVGDNWSVSAGYTPLSGLDLEVALTRFNALKDIEVLQRGLEIGWIDSTQKVSKPGYTVVDLFARWDVLDDGRYALGVGVYNLFDKRYRAHSSVADYTAIPDWEGIVGVYEPGRDVRLNISARF